MGFLGGRWGKWGRNRCYLFDKVNFTLCLVPSSRASGILTLARALGSAGLLTCNLRRTLSHSLPRFPYLLWSQRVLGCSQCCREFKLVFENGAVNAFSLEGISVSIYLLTRANNSDRRGDCSPHKLWFLESATPSSVSPQASDSVSLSPHFFYTKPTFRNRSFPSLMWHLAKLF